MLLMANLQFLQLECALSEREVRNLLVELPEGIDEYLVPIVFGKN